MKKILIASLMLCCVICQGQNYKMLNDSVAIFRGYTFQAPKFDSLRYDTIWYQKPDTLPCIMLVCDTSTPKTEIHGETFVTYPDDKVYWMKGYYIRDRGWNIIYLDADKQPLSKNIIVWISKGIN